MPLILHIETTTRACSVGLSNNGELLALRESLDPQYSHSSQLTVFMEEALGEAGKKPDDIDAVAVSQGPGSYTGLRIGVSAAKGFCYAIDRPLIAIDGLKALTVMAMHQLSSQQYCINPAALEARFCPMIDARRMEVYYSLFKHDFNTLQETKAEVIDENTFKNLLKEYKVVFFGDGASKCRSVIKSCNALFLDGVWPSARGMITEAEQKYARGDFANTAYFEPFYLKDFVAGKPTVKGLK